MVAATEVLVEIAADIFMVVFLEILTDIKVMDADRKNLYIIST